MTTILIVIAVIYIIQLLVLIILFGLDIDFDILTRKVFNMLIIPFAWIGWFIQRYKDMPDK